VSTHARPPLLARWLVRLRPLGEHRADVQADLDALFDARLAERGLRYARRRYLADALSLWLHRQPISEGAVVTRPHGRRPWPLEGVGDDVNFALRLLRRQVGTLSVAVVGLAAAIGLATVVFSFFNTFAFRPVGVPDEDSVVVLGRQMRSGRSTFAMDQWTSTEFDRLRDASRLVAIEAVSMRAQLELRQNRDDAESPVNVRFVGGTMVRTFGGRMSLGRAPDPTDDTPGAPPVAALQYAFWKKRFDGDPGVLGRTVFLNGVPVTIVGVFDRTFTGPFRTVAVPAIVLPWSAVALFPALADSLGMVNVELIGRLNRPATREQAEAELSGIAVGFGMMTPQGVREARTETLRVRPLRHSPTNEDLAVMAVFGTVVVLVLLLAATNVANLLLASATTRHQEIGTRLALGASRGRIVRQLLTESMLLGGVAGAAGLVASLWMTPIAAALLEMPPQVDFRMDWRIASFAAGVTVLAGVVAGLMPARFGAKGDVVASLRGGTAHASSAPKTARARAILVGVQGAIAIVLLAATTLFLRGLVQASTSGSEFDLEHVVGVNAPPRRNGVKMPDQQFWLLAAARARTVPGVDAAALIRHTPFSSSYGSARATLNGRSFPVEWNEASPEYFGAAGFRLLRGRIYTAQEAASQEPIAVVTSNIAEAFWPNGDVIGATLERVVGGKYRDLRIVGVVADPAPRVFPPQLAGAGIVFRPIADWSGAKLAVRVSDGVSIDALRSAVAAIDPARQPNVYFVRDSRERMMRMPRVMASVSGIVGGFALLLAVIGVFGVSAFVVGQRRREIGIRMAIGATHADVMRSVLMQGLRPLVIGLAVGAAATLLLAPLAGQLLYGGVAPRDPLAFSAAVAVLLLSATAGVLIPARRASQVDPASVLKEP
jgi:predicted permease